MTAAADPANGPARPSVWLRNRPAPKRRSEQPAGLDTEKIVAATVRLLDSEGLAKFSMRRLATELGVTAMSVYWYVDTKDDLLELALDSATGEIELPVEEESADWREQLRQLAAGFRLMLVTHPWVSRLIGEFLNVGPQSMAFSSVTQRVMNRSGLPPESVPGALSAVFQFVYGFGAIEGRFIERCRTAGISQEEYFQQIMRTVGDKMAGNPEFEDSRALIKARGAGTIKEMKQRDFDFALDLVIAGIEAKREGGTGG